MSHRDNLQSSLPYRPEIDGLRAVAILPVVFYHAGLGCPGGYTGVDVFFVISGFLISSLILRDLEAERFSFVEFWIRRVRRLLPAFAVCIGGVLVAGWFLLLPEDLADLGKATVAQVFLVANVYFWRTEDYFGEESFGSPLLHTWSLALEEQFYLLLPVALVILVRLHFLQQSRRLKSILILGMGISFLVSVLATPNHPSASFYLLPTRAWEFLLGVVLAAYLPIGKRKGPFPGWVAWPALAAILLPVFLYTEETLFPGLAAVPPCIGTALVIAAGGEENPGSRALQFLGASPLRFVGRISYSLYLWHWPVFAFVHYWALESLHPMTSLLLIMISFLLAGLSWRWVEQPFRRGVSGRTFRDAIPVFAIAMLCVAGLVFWNTSGAPDRIPASAREILAFLEKDSSLTRFHPAARNTRDFEAVRRGEFGFLGTQKGTRIDFVVLGDSHAQVSLFYFDELGERYGLSGRAITYQGTPPLRGWKEEVRNAHPDPESFFAETKRFIEENHVPCVFLLARWPSYESRVGSEELSDRLKETTSLISESGGQPIVLINAPVPGFDVPKVLLRRRLIGGGSGDISGKLLTDHLAEMAGVRALGASDSAGLYLDPLDGFVDPTTGLLRISDKGLPLYFDANHLTSLGTRLAWNERLEPVFRDMANEETSDRDRVLISQVPESFP